MVKPRLETLFEGVSRPNAPDHHSGIQQALCYLMPTTLPDAHRAAIIQAISNAAAPLHAMYGATIQSDGDQFKADFTGIANDLEHALELLGVKPDEVRTVTLPHD